MEGQLKTFAASASEFFCKNITRRNHLDDFKCGRMIRKPEEGSLTCVAEKSSDPIGTAARKVGGDIPRKTGAVDDRRIILQIKRAQYQSISAIAQQLCTATGQQVSQIIVGRCLHKGLSS
ncbi:hypothetical protein TNCV_2126261 [Trichonephila clavipes]|nr:hypothetical protein TNCV_2126261 [Trichonephila clavipes]